MITGVNSSALMQSALGKSQPESKRAYTKVKQETDQPNKSHPLDDSNRINDLQNLQVIQRDEFARLAAQRESARETAEIQGEQSRDMQKAMEIASRIMNGDNVPQSDKDFLLETSPGMFKLAMSARRLDNENPEDYDALARDRTDSDPAARVLGEDMVRMIHASFGGASNTQATPPSSGQAVVVSGGGIDVLG